MPFAALVIIHLDIMISFFRFYSSPKHITKKKKNHLAICTSTHTVRSIKSLRNNSSGFNKCSLTFGHSAMSRWKALWSLKLENSSLKNLYSHTAEKPETDFLLLRYFTEGIPSASHSLKPEWRATTPPVKL